MDDGEASELQSLAALGIASINLSASAQSGEVREAVAARFIANPAGSTVTTVRVFVLDDGDDGGWPLSSKGWKKRVHSMPQALAC